MRPDALSSLDLPFWAFVDQEFSAEPYPPEAVAKNFIVSTFAIETRVAEILTISVCGVVGSLVFAVLAHGWVVWV